MKIKLEVLIVFSLCLAIRGATAQGPPSADDFVLKHYAKHEYRIPMRDGVKLYAAVYAPIPEAFSGPNGDPGPYPFLVTRTPYSCAPYGENNVSPRIGVSRELLESGYIVVCEDARGRSESEGVFKEMSPHIDQKSPKDVDESTDMYDTIEFLLHNVQNNNGKVGITGYSYMGFYTAASIIDSHPAIKAASPQAPMTNLFFNDDWYHGGAFMMTAAFEFYAGFGPEANPLTPKRGASYDFGTPDGYKFFLQAGATASLEKELKSANPYFHDVLVHDTYDAYWKERDLSRHMKGVRAAVMVVGGWFDAEDLSGPFKTFHAIDEFNPGAVNSIVVGPWSHGAWNMGDGDRLGDVTFDQKTGVFFRAQILLPFFERYLKGRNADPLPRAYVFETGTNVWRKYDAWPPKSATQRMLYFREGGRLSFDPPAEKAASDRYFSDPAHPVPYINYTAVSVPQRYMTDDQRFASERTDVLTYETEPLTTDVTIVGPVRPELKVASTGTDSDFIVKLIDVYPDDTPNPVSDTPTPFRRSSGTIQVQMGGYEQLVRGEPMRAKFRDSWDKPVPLIPGKMVSVNSEMPDVNHTFRARHRIMVQVQSSWFPLTDRNPQTFVDIPFARSDQFVKATETVYRSASAPSGIRVLVLPTN
jgi:putative CocE/NonD family hydrolase